jgi:hypothetical protein
LFVPSAELPADGSGSKGAKVIHRHHSLAQLDGTPRYLVTPSRVWGWSEVRTAIGITPAVTVSSARTTYTMRYGGTGCRIRSLQGITPYNDNDVCQVPRVHFPLGFVIYPAISIPQTRIPAWSQKVWRFVSHSALTQRTRPSRRLSPILLVDVIHPKRRSGSVSGAVPP